MTDFHFFHPIEVRYGDLDPQGHLNNASYLTFMEQARIRYIQHVGIWRGGSFLDIGMILAEARVSFLQPVYFNQPVRVGVRTSRLGNKSFDMEYRFEDAVSSEVLATGSTVQVAYDYRQAKTIPVPDEWRAMMTRFDGAE